jgi:hypothetical protein
VTVAPERGRPQRRGARRGGTWRPPLALAAALVGLTACGSVKENLIARGFAPAYAEGYEAGCASGEAAAGGLLATSSKDADRYAADPQYTQGWDDGFAKCESDTAAMVRDARLRNPSKDNN